MFTKKKSYKFTGQCEFVITNFRLSSHITKKSYWSFQSSCKNNLALQFFLPESEFGVPVACLARSARDDERK